MKQVKEYVVGISLVAYSVWMLFNVVYGIISQISQLLAGVFSPEYWAMSWYLCLGSWISYIFMTLSAYRCVRASLGPKSWKYICVAGFFGLLAYCVPMVTFTIYSERFYSALPFSAIPIVIILAGLVCRSEITGTKPYIPILSLLKKPS